MGGPPARAATVAAVALAVAAAVLPAAASTAAPTTVPSPTGTGAAAATGHGTALVVHPRRKGPGVSTRVLGSNHRFPYAGYGMWNQRAHAAVPKVVHRTRRAGIKMLRYPGGSRADLFDWKEAVGPIATRGCQVFGRWGMGDGVRAVYGVNEQMKFAAAVGARTLITVPIANESAPDAADWVEYMNTPVGRNPNGGVAWARVRAHNGHPKPYRVHRWTVGNEPYLHNQRHWMSQTDSVALRQYVNGGRRTYHDQQVGRGCTLQHNGRQLRQHDRREILYPPVATQAPLRVTVNGHGWHEVHRFHGVGPKQRVYVLDYRRGKLTFGNNAHGARLPAHARVRVSYTSVHPGYTDMLKAMKHVDHSIAVCSEWGRPDFVAYMGRRHYDCVAAHPYKIFTTLFANRVAAHDALMDSEHKASGLIPRLRTSLRHHHHAGTPVGVTEFGAISVPDQPHARHWDLGLSDALFKASELVHMVGRGVPWATGGALTSHTLRSTIGTKPGFLASGWAVVEHALAPVLRDGHIVPSHVVHGPVRHAGRYSYRSLAAVAVRHGKRLSVVVVNRAPKSAVRAHLRLPAARLGGKSTKTVVSGAHVWVYNSRNHPHAVHSTTHRVRLKGSHPLVRYPAHSVTVLRLHLH